LDYDTLVIALKGKNDNFDIDDAVLQLKNLFVFYMYLATALSLIPDLQSVSGLVQVYQTLEEFQEAAAHQLLENSHCQGSLPVSISHL
jgi:hypothetical protein